MARNPNLVLTADLARAWSLVPTWGLAQIKQSPNVTSMAFDYDPRDPNNILGRYILDADGNPIEEPDLYKWAEWFGTADRRVARTKVAPGIRVSTVFLGIDHNFTRALGPLADGDEPILFETMVFNDYGAIESDDLFGRYATREEALAGHKRICATIRARLRKQKAEA